MSRELSDAERLRRALATARARAARAHQWAFQTRRALHDLEIAAKAAAERGYAKAFRVALAAAITDQLAKARETEAGTGWVEWNLSDLCELLGVDR